MRKQQFLKDVGGTLHFDCLEGRPSAATLTIKTPAGNDLPTAIDEASATITAVDTTVTSWASATPKQVVLASVSGCRVGSKYLITTALGRVGIVEVEAIDTAALTVHLQQPSPWALASGDAFEGIRISYAIVAGNAATTDLNYRAQWAYTVRGVAYQKAQLFDVVRAVPYRVADNPGLKRHAPKLVDEFQLSAVGQQGDWAEWLDEAFDGVLYDLEQKRNWAHTFIDMGIFERVTYERVLLLLADQGYCPVGEDVTEYYRRRERLYNAAFGKMLSSVPWVDSSEDLIVDADEELLCLSSSVLRR